MSIKKVAMGAAIGAGCLGGLALLTFAWIYHELNNSAFYEECEYDGYFG